MKVRLKSLLAICMIFLSMISCAREQTAEKVKWAGEVEFKNGIKIVKNPAEPLYGEITLELEEDLNIGREDDDNYLFYQPRNISIDDQKNIYILERGNHRIQKFSKDGQFLQTIGKKGQGPGEFERPYSLFVDKNNAIYVSDRGKIHFFDSTGEFAKTIPLSDQVSTFFVSSEGNIYGLSTQRSERARTELIVKMDSEGKTLKNITQFAEVNQVMRKSGNMVSTFSITHAYNQRLHFAFSNKERLYSGDSSEYAFSQINLEGEVELIIKKEESLHSISQKEKDKIFEGLSQLVEQWPKEVVEEAVQFPGYRPFFDRILTDDRGRIFIRRVRPVLDESENVEFDIFSPEGHYLYRAIAPVSPEIIQNGYVYDLHASDETGEVKIKKYQVLNWDQIAEKI
ncbi:MAG: NHL repeat-containing protein [Candidatus Aminicenantes bacterium]|jgi:hypothetical protein